MRRPLLYCCLLIALFSSCRKEDDPVFDQSPDERINETLQRYQSALTGATHGWKVLVYPSGIPNSVFSFYCRFSNANRVEMFSDFDSASFVGLKESSYRLKALQQPCLLFDTYSYIHVLCDPDASHNDGAYGVGLASDFEFSLEGIHGDTISLVGRLHRSKAVMIKATQQEADAYLSLQRNRSFDRIERMLTYYRRLTVGGARYDIRPNFLTRNISFFWSDEQGRFRSHTTGFYYTPTGIAFSPAFTDSTLTISRLDNITWDAGSRSLRVQVNNEAATIAEATRPLGVDTAAPRRWWRQADGSYWMSLGGFRVNGVDDAYNISSLPDIAFMGFWPQYSTSGGVTYDLLGFVLYSPQGLGIGYGPAFQPAFSTNGRVAFTYLGWLGELPADAAPVHNTRIKLSDQAGYYLFQTARNSYDMVSARDATAWTTWIR